MKGKALVIGAIVLLGALVVLWLAMRKPDDATASSRQPEGSATVVVGTKPPGTGVAPSLPSNGSAPAGSGGDPREYTVGDIQVRDHRAGDQKPIDIPPNVHPPESRQLPSEFTHAIGQKVKAVMLECAASIPREARGPAPRLEGQIIVGIKDQKLAISKATMLLRDVVGAAVDPVKSCIEQKSLGLQTAATEQPDMESYSINITFAIP